MKKKGFTLIELLIVVAIIAILAAIAVPNFLEAQTRSKVSRAKADMRSMATALESYLVDENTYPQCHPYGIVIRNSDTEPLVLERLTTPIAYMTSVIVGDPFSIKGRLSAANAQQMADSQPIDVSGSDTVAKANSYIYQSFNSEGRAMTISDGYDDAGLKGSAYILHSAGPNGVYHNLGGVLANDYEIEGPLNLIYDPTNGTISGGSVSRAGGSSAPSDSYAGGTGLLKAIRTQD